MPAVAAPSCTVAAERYVQESSVSVAAEHRADTTNGASRAELAADEAQM